MKSKITLILTLISTCYFSQKSTTKTNTAPGQENVNIIGQWSPIFDKDIAGKKLAIKTGDTDTLVFKKENKYIRYDKGAKLIGTWSLNTAKKIIDLKKTSFDMVINGKMENVPLNDSWERYERINKDTLTIVVYLEEVPNPKYNIRYYIKK